MISTESSQNVEILLICELSDFENEQHIAGSFFFFTISSRILDIKCACLPVMLFWFGATIYWHSSEKVHKTLSNSVLEIQALYQRQDPSFHNSD